MPSLFTTYQKVQIPESGDSANSRVWISDLNGDGHLDCEEEILQVMPARPLSRFTPSKVPQTFGFAALDHAAKLHCVNPFGMPHDLPEEADLPSLPYRDSDLFTYNDKEYEDRVTKMYDYHARWYDAALGRWGVVDPLAEEMPGMSPYNYVFNNPLIHVDPDGRFPIPTYGALKNINAWIAKKFSDASNSFNENANGGWYITSNFATVGGEKNLRKGDGDNVTNIIDDSPHAMGYSFLQNNSDYIEIPGIDDLLDAAEKMVDLVTAAEDGLVTPDKDGVNTSNGNDVDQDGRVDIKPGSQDWIMDGPPPGETDTIINSSGEIIERHRIIESGSLLNRRIQQ